MKTKSNTMELIFGRLPQPDERNRQYPILAAMPMQQERNYVWGFKKSVILNQGQMGCCVGCAFAYELALMPVPVQGITLEKAKQIYFEAQRTDPFPGGEYPGADPVTSGTSILAGVKTVKNMGFYNAYYWAASAYEIALGVANVGPAVIGIDWYQGMLKPDKTYRIAPTGYKIGGHAICVRGVNFRKQELLLQNSWGAGWGAGGCALISFEHIDRLLNQGGDAVFPIRNPEKTAI